MVPGAIELGQYVSPTSALPHTELRDNDGHVMVPNAAKLVLQDGEKGLIDTEIVASPFTDDALVQ